MNSIIVMGAFSGPQVGESATGMSYRLSEAIPDRVVINTKIIANGMHLLKTII
jgi:hypothetical protein